VHALLESAPGSPAELVDAVLAADERLHDEMDETTSGMGTTLAAVLVLDDTVVVANVGDSPVFVLEQDTSPPQLVQLTVDDVPPAEVSRSGMVTQSLGGFDSVDADEVHLHEDDHPAPRRLLVCTDGLSGFVPGEVISLVLDSLEDPAEVVRTLVELADAAGGLDNCTVAVVDIA
jgi:PPM family protein phosphatase